MNDKTRKAAYWSGIVTIGLLDFLALDDITTAGAWMPEIVFVIASIPALITLGVKAIAKPREGDELEGGRPAPRSIPPRV